MSHHHNRKRTNESKHEEEIPDQKKLCTAATTNSVSTTNTSETSTTASSSATNPPCTTSTLYVSNLHHRISEPHLQKLFQRFGEINRVHMIRRVGGTGSNHGGRSMSSSNSTAVAPSHRSHAAGGYTQSRKHSQPSGYSYAFVEFKSIQSASAAMEKLNGVPLLGKDLVVRPAHDREEMEGLDGQETSKNNLITSRVVKKQKTDVESKIDALKRVLREKESKSRSK